MRTAAPRIPFLILSDAIAGPTGLGRIARELAQHIQADPELSGILDVACLGGGAVAKHTLGIKQYTATQIDPASRAFPELPAVWQDHAGDRRGIVLAIMNPSWLDWMARPAACLTADSPLARFLTPEAPASRPFERWLYAPIDGETAAGNLPSLDAAIIAEFDYVAAYTTYGSDLIDDACFADYVETGGLPTPVLPHGIDRATWNAKPRAEARSMFRAHITGDPTVPGIAPETWLLGIVATNTPRKDFGLAFQTCRELADQGQQVALWIHTDQPVKAWNLPELAVSLGLLDRLILTTGNLTDETLAWLYSACDCTLAIGSGEGWGYAIAESLACGVPVIHGDYAGGAEFVPETMLVSPAAYRVEPNSGLLRPVYDPAAWAGAVVRNLGYTAALPGYIDWAEAWPAWRTWLLDGLKGIAE